MHPHFGSIPTTSVDVILSAAMPLGVSGEVCPQGLLGFIPVGRPQANLLQFPAVLVTAVSTIAFKQAIGMLRRGGTCVLNGLPPGEVPVSIFDLVLNGYTIRGSIVGTRLDLEEALSFAAEGKVKAIIETKPLESINDVFQRLKTGMVNGRVVLAIGAQTSQEAFKKSA